MKDKLHIQNFNEHKENLNINENKLVELESSLQKVDKIKELLVREIKKNKITQYSDKRNNKFNKMLKELSKFCDDFKDKWGKELHYL